MELMVVMSYRETMIALFLIWKLDTQAWLVYENPSNIHFKYSLIALYMYVCTYAWGHICVPSVCYACRNPRLEVQLVVRQQTGAEN